MKLVVVESPYKATGRLPDPDRETIENVAYACAAMRDCFLLGEAPFAPHLLYTRVGILDDTLEMERAVGIRAGLEWAAHAHLHVFYLDLGISDGMRQAFDHALSLDTPIEFRSLDDWANKYDCAVSPEGATRAFHRNPETP